MDPSPRRQGVFGDVQADQNQLLPVPLGSSTCLLRAIDSAHTGDNHRFIPSAPPEPTTPGVPLREDSSWSMAATSGSLAHLGLPRSHATLRKRLWLVLSER
jgi:hypothetical protein